VRGNLLLPDAPGDVAVLMLHGWGGLRSGPHNLITHLARALATAGVPSLRFDFRSRGESSGDDETDGATLPGMAADALAAANLLIERSGASKLVTLGLCSGGNVAIGILDRLPKPAGLFLLSVYPFSDGDAFGRDVHRTAHYLGVYWRKLWMRETWRKFFRGEIFFRSIGKVLFGHYFAKKDDQLADSAESASEDHRKNLRRVSCPVEMIYGDADPDFEPSHAYFAEYQAKHQLDIHFHVIPGANHNYFSLAWKDQITERLLSFVRRA
jgi:pimeloyl-ACP methyl ester carboxylesterase